MIIIHIHRFVNIAD